MEFKHESNKFNIAIGISDEEYRMVTMLILKVLPECSKKSQIIEKVMNEICNNTSLLQNISVEDSIKKMFILGWILNDSFKPFSSLTTPSTDKSPVKEDLDIKDIFKYFGKLHDKKESEIFDIETESETIFDITENIISKLNSVKRHETPEKKFEIIKLLHEQQDEIDFDDIPRELLSYFIEDVVGCNIQECPAMKSGICKIYKHYKK